jgi:hypothetical protein
MNPAQPGAGQGQQAVGPVHPGAPNQPPPMQPGLRPSVVPSAPPGPVVRPTSQPSPASTSPDSRVIHVPPLGVSTVTTSTGPAAHSQPAVGGAIVGHEEIDQWGHKAVAAHGPIPERPPIKPQDRSAPSRAFQSGDLECRSCGEANLPELKFCRRCGRNLADAKVVGPSRWQKLRSLLESEHEPPV